MFTIHASGLPDSIKRLVLILLFLASPATAAPMTQDQLDTANSVAKLIVHHVVKQPDGSYTIWTRSSIQWYGFTIYTCAMAPVSEFLATAAGKDMTTYEMANMQTPNGGKATWMRSPWGNTPPDNIDPWCWE